MSYLLLFALSGEATARLGRIIGTLTVHIFAKTGWYPTWNSPHTTDLWWGKSLYLLPIRLDGIEWYCTGEGMNLQLTQV